MEGFAGFICPNSPNVWDGNRLSTCFVDMVFGFGANVVTVVMLSVLWFVRRNVQGSWMCTWHKLFIYLMPALGVCLSFYDMIDLFKSSFHGQAPVYYKWFFRCSQFASWMTIMLFLKCENWSSIFCYWIMCIWWIVKPLLQIPHLQIVFSTSEAIMRVKESSFVVVEIIFGMYVNIFSVSCATRDRTIASLEDPLLLSDKDMKGDHEWSICNYWNLLTFKYANTMMDHGVVKQLDFEDLIQLPDELLPSTCHSTLLSCWVAEQSKNRISPSLFCALFHAYGWPYLRLGLLKVTNDAIGFLGPIFLNKLIKFLQRGSGLDGYVLAISLGLTSALKSFLDTQYTFRLSRLKLKLRSSIMTIVYCKSGRREIHCEL